jgi:hypothetical protein
MFHVKHSSAFCPAVAYGMTNTHHGRAWPGHPVPRVCAAKNPWGLDCCTACPMRSRTLACWVAGPEAGHGERGAWVHSIRRRRCVNSQPRLPLQIRKRQRRHFRTAEIKTLTMAGPGPATQRRASARHESFQARVTPRAQCARGRSLAGWPARRLAMVNVGHVRLPAQPQHPLQIHKRQRPHFCSRAVIGRESARQLNLTRYDVNAENEGSNKSP